MFKHHLCTLIPNNIKMRMKFKDVMEQKIGLPMVIKFKGQIQNVIIELARAKTKTTHNHLQVQLV